jgi:hypothetical protein
MRRSTYLRLGAIGMILLSSLSVGAIQVKAAQTCPKRGVDYINPICQVGCPDGSGYCSAQGFCQCGNLP